MDPLFLNLIPLCNLYLDNLKIYIESLPLEKQTLFFNFFSDKFFNTFGCKLELDNFIEVLKTNDRLRRFMLRKGDLLLKLKYKLISLDDDVINELFYNFYENDLDDVISEDVSSDIELPKTVNRYHINSIISEFSYDIINNKNVDLQVKYKNSKKLIVVFCFLCVLSQFNKKYVISYEDKLYDFSDDIKKRFNSLKYRDTAKGDFNFYSVKDKDKVSVINKITDCFSHISGNFNFIHSTNTIEIKNRFNSTYTLDIDEFINDMNDLFYKDIINAFKKGDSKIDEVTYLEQSIYFAKKSSLGIFLTLITSIENDYYNFISKNEIIFLMGYLELCFNKEATLDNQVMSQYSLIDVSKFELNYGSKISDEEKSNIELFKSHNFIFSDDKSKRLMTNTWGDYINNLSDVEKSKEYSCLCNVDLMCFDKKNKLYFPASEIIKHLRNSLRHGRYYLEDDIIVFYDQKDDKDENTKYFYLSISINDFVSFLNDSVLQEVIHYKFDNFYENDISVKDYKNSINHRKFFFYDFEKAYAKNSFLDYMNICRTRFPGLTNKEFVAKLYENNLFSRYLVDNPENFDDFLGYIFEDGEALIDILRENHNFDIDINLNLDNTLNVVNMKNYIKELISIEKSILYTDESIFFPLYVESLLKENMVELVDVRFSDNYYALLNSCIQYREFLLSNFDFDSPLSEKFYFSIALNVRNDIKESEKLLAIYFNKERLKKDLVSDSDDYISYSNYKQVRNDSRVYLNSTSKIVSKLKKRSLYYKNISEFFNIFGIAKLGLLGLASFQSFNAVNDVSCLAHYLINHINIFSSYLYNKYLEYSTYSSVFKNAADIGEHVVTNLGNDSSEFFKNNVRGPR